MMLIFIGSDKQDERESEKAPAGAGMAGMKRHGGHGRTWHGAGSRPGSRTWRTWLNPILPRSWILPTQVLARQ